MYKSSLSSFSTGLNAFGQTQPVLPSIPITLQEKETSPTVIVLTLLGTVAGAAAAAAIQYFVFCQALKRCK